MNGSIFQNFWPNLNQNWLKIKKILEKIGNFVQNLAQNWADWVPPQKSLKLLKVKWYQNYLCCL